MQDAETVLNVIRERGERGLPLENIYRLLYNRNLYLRAYGRIYSTHISHINPADRAVISNICIRCSRIAEHIGYHEC